MIRRFTGRPSVEFDFRADLNLLRVVWFWLTVDARGKKLKSKEVMKVDPAEWSPEVNAKLASLSAALHSVAGVLIPLSENRPANYSKTCQTLSQMAENQQWKAEWKAVVAEDTALLAELASLRGTITTPDFRKRIASRAIILEADKGDNDERSFALYRGAVWVCNRPLTAAQWQLLVNRLMQREESKLACALAGASATSQTRERLSDEVRHAVWIRDQGKCARCGKRERLEYDHIVPVSRGGSNTERNIELLCEVCNRAKSDSIM
jgi:hypothetical protein